MGDVDEGGDPVKDDTFLIMLNCHHEPIQFFVPKPVAEEGWEIVVDTNNPELTMDSRFCALGESIELTPLSMVVAREARPRTLAGKLSE